MRRGTETLLPGPFKLDENTGENITPGALEEVNTKAVAMAGFAKVNLYIIVTGSRQHSKRVSCF